MYNVHVGGKGHDEVMRCVRSGLRLVERGRREGMDEE